MSEAKYIKTNSQYEIYPRESTTHVRQISLWMLIPFLIFTIIGAYLIFNSLGIESTGLERYKVNGDINYQVYLKDNDYYSEKSLGPGKQYIASLINIIRADFDYKLEADESIDAHYTYDIIAAAKATDKSDSSKVLYERTDVIKSVHPPEPVQDGVIEIDESVDIDYGKYNDYMRSFRTEFSLAANCLLDLKLVVSVDGEIKTEDTLAMNIPLSDQTVDITMDVAAINREEKVGEEIQSLYVKNLSGLIIGAIITVASTAAIITVICLYRTRFGDNWYAEALHKIFHQYDTNIVNISETFHEPGEILRVDSFVELLDAANNENAPILFCEVVPDYKAYFVVEGATATYRYTLSRKYQDELRRAGAKKEF